MTPKEKAESLINKYNLVVLDKALGGSNRRVKQCALIAVDEIIHYFEIVLGVDKEDFRYWYEVKQEIEKLKSLKQPK
mgnify:CR=1 FL=1